MRRILCTTLVLTLLSFARAEVPPPAATPCEVVMSGRTITLKRIVIAATGQEIPPTYSGSVKNTPGMSWYVSRHYALKTDWDQITARRFLTYAELAYPFHVWVVGRVPPDQDRLRMPFVMGTTYDRMADAILTDGGWRPGSIGGGGITYYGMKTAYNFPSGTQQYHQRDLVMHENLHLLQMCCDAGAVPHRIMEGITYTTSNHVYDDRTNRLTMAVFDKPTVNNPVADQLRDIEKTYRPFRAVCQSNLSICLFNQFMWSDPDRLLKWRLWRDSIQWEGRAGEDMQIMEDLFGSLDGRIEQDWKNWLAGRHCSFHYRDWGWEQSADTLMAYGWPQVGPYSRTDVLLPPGVKPEYDPLRMDYPLQPVSQLVGPIRSGVEEPSVGALISFSRCPGQGQAGIGLGVQVARPTQELSYLPLLIRGRNILAIEGKDLGITSEAAQFPETLRYAMAAGRHKIGMTVKIGKESLEVMLRARDPEADAPVEFVKRWPISPAQRARLLSCPGTILAKDGWHEVTPYFEDGRRPESADLDVPASGDRWRFAGMEKLETIYRALRRLGANAPVSLVALKNEMLLAADKDSDTQKKAVEAYESRIVGIFRDVRDSSLSSATRSAALAELLGASFDFGWKQGAGAREVVLAADLRGLLTEPVQCAVSFKASPPTPGIRQKEAFAVALDEPFELQTVTKTCEATDPLKPTVFTATAELKWRGENLTLTRELAAGPTCVPCWWVIGPFENKGGGTVDTPQAVEKGPVSLTNAYDGILGRKLAWSREMRPLSARLSDEFVLNYAAMFGAENASAYALARVDCVKDTDAVLAIGSDDGVVVWLNGEKVHANLVSRGYGSRQDRVPIRLKAGANKLMVKVMRGGGGWAMGAHITDAKGSPLPGISYPLDSQ